MDVLLSIDKKGRFVDVLDWYCCCWWRRCVTIYDNIVDIIDNITDIRNANDNDNVHDNDKSNKKKEKA